ncbi:MAG: HD domain-containing protein [Sporomusaceae bacterium]|nr:HD domain-containing protein [Sporomusaceae bacterium]
MKKITALLSFAVIAFTILSTINDQLTEYRGIDYFIALNGVSILLLIFIAYAFFSGHRNAAQHSRPENRALFMHMPGAVMTLEKDFTIIDVNELMRKVTGFHPGAIKGKKCYDVLGNGDICCDCLVQKALISGRPECGARLKYDKNGQPIYGKQTVIPIKDQAGNIEYVYEIVTDITQEVSLERENLDILMDIVTSMAHLIESRDPSTRTHCINVQSVAVSIGEIMGLSDKERKELSIAAILHDIGKIGIPEAILNKPQRLTEDEFAIIKRHPQIGYDAIKHIKRLQNVSQAIQDHHEHCNGQGYPNGKKKDDIPMIARILAVADVFEALTSDRVYRRAMSLEQAIDIIQAGKEQQFDPIVVDALLALVEQRNK